MDNSIVLRFHEKAEERILELNRMMDDRRKHLVAQKYTRHFINDPYYRELEGARNEVVNCNILLREVANVTPQQCDTRRKMEDKIAYLSTAMKMKSTDLAFMINGATLKCIPHDADDQLATLTDEEVRKVLEYMEGVSGRI